MKRVGWLFVIGMLVLPIVAYAQATITVGSVTTAVGGTATVNVAVSNVPSPGVTDIQGTISFDPKVVHITDIVGLNGFSGFFFKNIDNNAGTASFTGAIVGDGSVTTGNIFQITLQAVGAAGDTSPLNLTMSVFRAKDGTDIPKTVTPGTFTISSSIPPVADFSYTPQTPSISDTITFIDKSSDKDGSVVGWSWNFGDGSVSLVQNPTHQYVNGGTYTVTLTVTDNDGNTDTTSKQITVSGPSAAFTYSPTSPTTQDAVHFFDQSVDKTADIVSWSWTFGDGGTSADQNPVHTFGTSGTYRVVLTISDKDGKTVSTSRSIVVKNAPPIAKFTFSPATPKVGEMVTFSAGGSKDPDGNIVMFAWDFNNDGKVDATGSTVTHAFSSVGAFTVRLTVTDNDGATGTATEVVPVQTSAPQAAFTFTPSNPKIGQTVTFNASGSTASSGPIILYQWDFNGDGTFDATGKTVTHTFTKAGSYPVKLKITDNNGGVGYVTKVVPVQSSPPVASFTFSPAKPNTGQVVSFDASKSTAPDGSIILYEWDFDHDGKTDATGMAVTHAFAKAGVYPVTLKVTDNNGNIGAETKAVPVQMGGTGGANQPPIANFEFSPKTAHINEVVTFKATGCSDKDGTIVSYEWDFNNDGVYDATGTTVSHVFHRGGGQIVTLKVLDNDGAPGYKTEVVPVEFVRPTADFTYTPTNPEVGDVITFDGSKSSAPDGRIEFYEWDFNNDGKTDATGMTVTHVFTTGGSKSVTLKVTDNDGVTNYITKPVFIRINNPPIADFGISPTNPTTADKVTFISKSYDTDGTIVAWLWSFGDGTTSSVQTPSHKYTAAKKYTVKLTVTDNDGATGSVTKQITVSKPANVPPVANFTFSPSIANVNKPVQFTDKSTDVDGTVAGWSWNFGDGGTSTAKNPTHTYTKAGTYVVTLVVTDNDGAKSAPITKQIAVGQPGTEVVTHAYPNPVATRATISYILPTGATAPTIYVYDIAGNLVYEHALTAGASTYSWDLTTTAGNALPNGLYFYMITAKDATGKGIHSAIFKLLIQR